MDGTRAPRRTPPRAQLRARLRGEDHGLPVRGARAAGAPARPAGRGGGGTGARRRARLARGGGGERPRAPRFRDGAGLRRARRRRLQGDVGRARGARARLRPRRAGHPRVAPPRRRLPHHGAGLAVRGRGGGRGRGPRARDGVLDGRGLRTVARQRAGAARPQSLRLHPLRGVPQPERAEAPVGGERPRRHRRVEPRAEPRLQPAEPDPGAVGQPHRRAGGRGRGARHRRGAGGRVGGAGARPTSSCSRCCSARAWA